VNLQAIENVNAVKAVNLTADVEIYLRTRMPGVRIKGGFRDNLFT
jgi:hypothetical protein